MTFPGHTLMGREVTLKDGRSGRVVFEAWGQMDHPDGRLPGVHRLIVEVREKTCTTCPHGDSVVIQTIPVLVEEVVVT